MTLLSAALSIRKVSVDILTKYYSGKLNGVVFKVKSQTIIAYSDSVANCVAFHLLQILNVRQLVSVLDIFNNSGYPFLHHE